MEAFLSSYGLLEVVLEMLYVLKVAFDRMAFLGWLAGRVAVRAWPRL